MSFQSHKRGDAQERFRECVLDALDVAAARYVGEAKGWTDQDLPKLFKALDAQVERWAARNDIALLDPVESGGDR